MSDAINFFCKCCVHMHLASSCCLAVLLLPSALSFSVQFLASKQLCGWKRHRERAGAMASVLPSAATESDSKKSVKDLTLVFCRRTRRISDTGSEGGGGDVSSGDSDDDAKEILLGMKKRGFGEGKWNGFGGKVESGESVEEAAKRELMEEAGVTARELSLRGRLIFHVPSYPSVMRVHVYEAVSFEGEPEESEEMRPRWFGIRDLPLKEMWVDDEHWMPLFLEGKSFRGEFHFSDEQTILRHVLEAVTPQEMTEVVL